MWVVDKQFNADNTTLDATLKVNESSEKRSLVVSLQPNKKYQVFLNKKELEYKEISSGVLQVDLPANTADVKLQVKAR